MRNENANKSRLAHQKENPVFVKNTGFLLLLVKVLPGKGLNSI